MVWKPDRLRRNLADFDPAHRPTRTAQDPLRIAGGAFRPINAPPQTLWKLPPPGLTRLLNRSRLTLLIEHADRALGEWISDLLKTVRGIAVVFPLLVEIGGMGRTFILYLYKFPYQ